MSETAHDFQPEREALTLAPTPTWANDILAPQDGPLATAGDFEALAGYWKRLKARIDEITAFFHTRKAEVQVVLNRVRKDEKDSLGEYPKWERIAAHRLGQYDLRQREAAEAERKRQETEAKAKLEADQLAAALQADADGAEDVAMDILEEPLPQTLVRAAAPQTPKVEGLTMPGSWKAEVVDLDRLIIAAALEIQKKQARVGASMLTVNQKGVNSQATAMKQNLQKIASRYGLRVWEDRTPRRQ